MKSGNGENRDRLIWGKGNKKESVGMEAGDGNAYGEIDRGRAQEGRGNFGTIPGRRREVT